MTSQMKSPKNVAGLILAAGKSDRMGSPKPLLHLGGETFAARLIRSIQNSVLTDFLVVLGHRHEEIRAKLALPIHHFIVNSDYELGQFSSLKCGLHQLEKQNLDGVMVFLIDHPLITAQLINLLVKEFSQSNAFIVIPTYQGKRGHPVVFGRGLFEELFSAPLENGAKAVVRAHQDDILHVPVEEDKILVDVDTQSDYEMLLRKFGEPGSKNES